MTFIQTLSPKVIGHAADGGALRSCRAFQVGDGNKFLVERDAQAPSGWKLVDRLDRSVEPDVLHRRYGVWEDKAQSTAPATMLGSLLDALGAYPMVGPDRCIQANEVTRFLAPDTMHVEGWGTSGRWSSTRLEVQPGERPKLVETGDSTCIRTW
jgi:hypothetical protein